MAPVLIDYIDFIDCLPMTDFHRLGTPWSLAKGHAKGHAKGRRLYDASASNFLRPVDLRQTSKNQTSKTRKRSPCITTRKASVNLALLLRMPKQFLRVFPGRASHCVTKFLPSHVRLALKKHKLNVPVKSKLKHPPPGIPRAFNVFSCPGGWE